MVVEQIVRPTGLIDPEVVVRPTKGQIDDLVEEIRVRAERDQRVLVTTLTKKMAEDLTDYLLELGMRVRYLHSEVDTLGAGRDPAQPAARRVRRAGGHQPAARGTGPARGVAGGDPRRRQGGFLRSQTSLIQTIGRAARNVEGQVVMYADQMTDSMRHAISETNRRRKKQLEYNPEHGIDPQTMRKKVTDILDMLRGSEMDSGSSRGRGRGRGRSSQRSAVFDLSDVPPDDLGRLIQTLQDEMAEAATELRFEEAARLRDEINELKRELRPLNRLLSSPYMCGFLCYHPRAGRGGGPGSGALPSFPFPLPRGPGPHAANTRSDATTGNTMACRAPDRVAENARSNAGGRNHTNSGATSVRKRGPYAYPAHQWGKSDTRIQ